MTELTPREVLPIIKQALAEDRAQEDITSQSLIPLAQHITAQVIAKSPGIAAGVHVAELTFTTLDPTLSCRRHVRAGAAIKPGTVILTVEGRARSIFAAERTALNFLMHLSGIATLTQRFVRQTRGTRAKILDTRKTLPGLRALEKDAVRAGGGVNHRNDLSEAILIKTNQLRALGRPDITAAIAQARRWQPGRFLQIEVTNLAEFRQALAARPDALLLDNWQPAALRRAVRLRGRAKVRLEASGGITLANVRTYARTGVDRISIGRLTHSAPALDFSLRVRHG